MKILREIFDLLKTTFQEWNADGAPRLAAALSYYTAFSIAPLLVILIAILSFIVNQDTVRSEILTQVQASVGAEAAEQVKSLIDNAAKPSDGLISLVLGVVGVLLGAIGVFGNLQMALDIIWNAPVENRPSGIVALIKDKILSFGMLLVVGFLLLVSLVASTLLSVLNTHVISLLPAAEIFAGVLNIGLSFAMTTVLFAMIYKYLPHVRLTWRDVLVGAAVTSLLFTIGRTLLGSYLGSSSTASAFGAAGAFVLILLWVYYSSQIILFGAEFTQVFARRYGSLKDVPNTKPTDATPQTAIVSSPASTPATNVAPSGRLNFRDVLFGVGVLLLALVLGRGNQDEARSS
jgi:membrane protein